MLNKLINVIAWGTIITLCVLAVAVVVVLCCASKVLLLIFVGICFLLNDNTIDVSV